MNKISRMLRDPRLLIVFLMGFSSGLPLLLVGGTLKGWMTDRGVDLTTVGLFSVVGLAYSFKFLWSPLMDFIKPPLGRRRGWLVITQVGLAVSLFALSMVDPAQAVGLFAGIAFVVAFFSASQDIVIDAYRREILPDSELGLGSSLAVQGYRVGMWVAGGGAFLLAGKFDWSMAYQVMAIFMALSIGVTFLAPEPVVEAAPPKTLKESVVGPLLEFFKRDGAWLILAFIVLYKIGESMASDMTNPLFLQLGFSKIEIGAVAKTFGLWAAISGGLVGGIFIMKLGIYRSLWVYGILQSFGLLLFSWLAMVGNDWTWLAIAIVIETFTSGMATTAFVAFMASQTNKRFTATQYALLSSLMSVPRILGGMCSGWLALHTGWVFYFVLCAVFTIPGLLLLFRIKPMIVTESAEANT